MGSDIDLEAGKAAQAAPRVGVFFHSFPSPSIPLEVLTVREEEVGAVETHGMDILGPHEQGGKLIAVGSNWPRY
jgi:hypothetical protein